MGAVLLGVGALVAWLCVAGLHYSDGPDRRLAQGVAILDSAALLFVVLHFSFLVWVFGHLTTLQSAEKKYEEAAARFNAEAREIQAGNVEIARTAERIAQETTKRARLENDTAYQQRRAAEAGGILRSGSRPSGSTSVARSGDALALATAPVELERPTKPAESSAAFPTKLDAVIRLANLAELLLACLTLILIRNRSAQTNSPTPTAEFIPLASTSTRAPTFRPTFRKTHGS